jgi:hypothetical protein
MVMDIRRLLDRFFDTKGFTDEQLIKLWKQSTLNDSFLGNKIVDVIEMA